MPLSYILPTLVDAFVERLSPSSPSSSSPYHLQSTPTVYPARYPTLFHPKAVEAATSSACTWTTSCVLHWAAKLASNLVPCMNLFLGLLVCAYLVDERVHGFLVSQFTLTPPPASVVPAGSLPFHTRELKAPAPVSPSTPVTASSTLLPLPDADAPSKQPALSTRATLTLSFILFAVMLSMVFVSNAVFDIFASSLPHTTPDLRSLLPLAAYFASFTLLVCFLIIALLLTILPLPLSDPAGPTRAVFLLLSGTLLFSSVLSRFPLGVFTLFSGSWEAETGGKDVAALVAEWLPHLMMLAVEPAVLMGVMGWVGMGMLAGEGAGDKEEVIEEEKLEVVVVHA